LEIRPARATLFDLNAELVQEQITKLATELHGSVLVPGEEGYAAERSGYNLNNRPVAVRATGHQVVRSAREAVLIHTSRLNGVHIDGSGAER
jgi:hypothetical protein